MGPFSETVRLLSAIGTCHGCLCEVAQRCRGNATVTAVTHWFDIYEHDTPDNKGFRVEEYVSAELASGEATDWCIELVGSEITSPVHLVVDLRRYNTSGHEAREIVVDEAYADLPRLAEAMCSAVAKLAQISAVT